VIYRWAFGPPRPALARVRGGSLNFVLGQPSTNSHCVMSCSATGYANCPSPGSSCRFVSGQHGITRPCSHTRAAQSPLHRAVGSQAQLSSAVTNERGGKCRRAVVETGGVSPSPWWWSRRASPPWRWRGDGEAGSWRAQAATSAGTVGMAGHRAAVDPCCPTTPCCRHRRPEMRRQGPLASGELRNSAANGAHVAPIAAMPRHHAHVVVRVRVRRQLRPQSLRR
jgi:hypothetical protein